MKLSKALSKITIRYQESGTKKYRQKTIEVNTPVNEHGTVMIDYLHSLAWVSAGIEGRPIWFKHHQ